MPPKRPRPPPDDPVWDLVEQYGDFSDPELALLTPPPTEDASRRTDNGDRVWPQAGPAPKKKKLKEGEVEPERRLKVYKKGEPLTLFAPRSSASKLTSFDYGGPACPKATQERADRVRLQRFFCVDRQRTSPISEQFSVLGSTGNLYTVKVGHLPSCDCPDGAKGNHCKHLVRPFIVQTVCWQHIHPRSCFPQLFVLLKGTLRFSRCSVRGEMVSS